MKNLVHLLIFVIFYTSCATKSSNKIGILLPDLRKERWQKDEAFLKQRAKELNLEFILHDAAGNSEKQLNQAKELINNGVKVIIIGSVNANVTAAVVRDAHKKNIKVIAYDRLIKNSDLDYYVSHNNIQVGEQLAKFSTSIYPKGNYILLLGDRADHNAIFVKEGIMKILSPMVRAGDVEIVYQSFMERWKGTEANFTLNRFIQLSPDSINAVIACGDGMAQGVIKSLKENNLDGKVCVTGQNADLFAIKSILNNEQSMTVYKPLKDLSFAAIDLAELLLKGKQPSNINANINNGRVEVPSILIPVQTVHKENIDEVLIKSGFYTKVQVYSTQL